MARRAFYSFHYKPDNWRASQVRNMGVIEGNSPVTDNEWETITGGGDEKIKKWINDQLNGKSCAIVLIGEKTAGRKWIKYEIERSWYEKKGILGIHIHKLKDNEQNQSQKGKNPFEDLTLDLDGGKLKLSDIVKAYSPPYSDSAEVYKYIKENLSAWVEAAIAIREKY